jgi:hypothetical protein
VSLERGASRQLKALVVDENNNETTVTALTWGSSDLTRATVDANGNVQALRNGRVLITASFGNRTTVGIVHVVRPKAVTVKVLPQTETMGFGQVQQFFAKALDAAGRVIGDAVGFQWSSSNTSSATVGSTGVVTAKPVEGSADISATIDGKVGSAALTVVASLPPGTINGVVKDGSSDTPLAGATITAPGCSATSATDGSFSLPCVTAGDDITFAKTSYASVTFYDAPAFPNKTIQIPAIPLSPAGGDGTMIGKVVNALTGNGVSGMTIKAYTGLHAAPSPRRPDVTPAVTGTSASDGTFSIQAPAGAYTFAATGTGYSDGVGVGISISGATKQTPPIIMPPNIPGGGLFVVVTWGDCGASAAIPCDLDAHLTGPKLPPDDASRFHVFKGSTTSSYVVELDTIANLDVERNAAGTRPEVIGLRPSGNPGIYRFYVHDATNASNSTSLALSNLSSVRVDIFQDNRVIASFFPPANQPGTLWEVFNYDGARIIPVGTISHTATPSSLP